MVFVQYFHKGAVSGNLIPACGDRSVVILDGRCNINALHSHAKQLNGVCRPRYEGYQLNKGRTLNDCKPISEVINTQEQ